MKLCSDGNQFVPSFTEKMQKILFYLVACVCVFAHGELSGKNHARKGSTNNLEVLRARSMEAQQFFNQTMKNGRRKSITMGETIFTLHTRRASNGVRVILNNDASLAKGGFNPRNPTFFVTHGFLSSADTSWVINMKNAQLSVLDCNFFTIDWSACTSDLFYPGAVYCVPIVGNYLSEMIQFIKGKGADVKKMHLIGHSLGAHVMAQVSLHGIVVSRITGLDPASPMFSKEDTDSRIDSSDADYVDIIHSSRGIYGYVSPTGMWDFYPNGGQGQPGCIRHACDHAMSHDFYIATISNNRAYPAVRCNSFEDASNGNCDGPTSYMGVLGTKGPPGIYYTEISSAPPVDNS